MPAIREFGSEFDWNANAAYIAPGACQRNLAKAAKYRSGRDAMKAVAKDRGIAKSEVYKQIKINK